MLALSFQNVLFFPFGYLMVFLIAGHDTWSEKNYCKYALRHMVVRGGASCSPAQVLSSSDPGPLSVNPRCFSVPSLSAHAGPGLGWSWVFSFPRSVISDRTPAG